MEGFNGSYMFEPLSLYLKIPLDQVNFIVVQLFGVIFGHFFRQYLTCNKIGSKGRHLVELFVGFSMLFFCFGVKAFMLMLQTAICYFIIFTLPHSCGILSLIACMAVLAVCHWKRLYYDPVNYITVDITGPLMINTQRMTSLAFGIADGWKKRFKDEIHRNCHVGVHSHDTCLYNDKSSKTSNNLLLNGNYNSNSALNNNRHNGEVEESKGKCNDAGEMNGGLMGGSVIDCNVVLNGDVPKHIHNSENNKVYNNYSNIGSNNKNNDINDNYNNKERVNGIYKEENHFLTSKTINEVPSIMKLLSYTYCFHTVICGPFSYYHDYINFIEENIPKKNKKSDKEMNHEFSYRQLNPNYNIAKNLATALTLVLLSLYLAPFSNMTKITESGFASSLGVARLCLYVLVVSHVAKFKYYVAWKLADAMNSSVGLSFNGWDEKGKEKWDLIKNVDIFKVETATNLQMVFKHWNKTTSSWLRYTIYERTRSTYLVFAISALWHGFFPGYYISFISGAFFITVSRMARKVIRPFFVPQRQNLQSQYSIPNQSQPSIPNQSQPYIPNQSQPSIPNQSQTSIPNQPQHSIPNQSQHSIPNQSQQSIPNQSQLSIPNQSDHSFLYDIITIVITKIQLAYLGSAFMLLDMRKSLQFYTDLHFILHIINVLAFFVLLYATKRMPRKEKAI